MKRIIKFRAWDKKNNSMISDVSVCNGWVEFDREQYGKHDEFIPMQFTGLFDRHGVGIYEGDIVKYKRYDDSWFGGYKTVIRKVTWDTYYGASWNFGISYKDGEKRWSYPFPDGCEVIGNLYENPELLRHGK